MKIYAIEYESTGEDFMSNWTTHVTTTRFETYTEAEAYIPVMEKRCAGFGRNYHVVNLRKRAEKEYNNLLEKAEQIKNEWNL